MREAPGWTKNACVIAAHAFTEWYAVVRTSLFLPTGIGIAMLRSHV